MATIYRKCGTLELLESRESLLVMIVSMALVHRSLVETVKTNAW